MNTIIKRSYLYILCKSHSFTYMKEKFTISIFCGLLFENLSVENLTIFFGTKGW